MAENTEEILAQLRRLSGGAKKNIFERVRLATELLDNEQWVEARYKGDQYGAGEEIQELFFSDVWRLVPGGIFSLVDIYRSFPKEKDWRKAHYNLKTMYGFWQEKRQAAKSPPAEPSPGAILPTESLHQIFQRLWEENQRLRKERDDLLGQMEDAGEVA